jgi:Spy/CpxP family protein refolding chaperone
MSWVLALYEKHCLSQRELLMNKNRFRKRLAVAAGFFILCAAPGLTRGQSASPSPALTPKVASPGAQPKRDSSPPDDFAGLQYTNEQKAEIDQIRRETRSRKEVVLKDEKLTADQKNAMILGYTRLEYGQIYNVLTPDQKKEVGKRNSARRAADQAAHRKQPPAK